MPVTRRSFLTGATAFAAAPSVLAHSDVGVRLRLGVLSDIHVGCAGWEQWHEFMSYNVHTLVRALRHFRDAGVDGVVIAGDLADYGMIYEMEAVAEAWRHVFPGDRLPDGRRVERLFVTGNHDWEGFLYRDFGKRHYPDSAALAKAVLQGNMKESWERIWGEPYQPVWTKSVKGYTFVGAHWEGFPYTEYGNISFAGAPEAILAAGAAADPEKPFFYIQHPLPKDTNYGPNGWGHDRGDTTAALSKFPNAFAISGHSHYSLTDGNSLWQGAFTSLSMSSLRYGSAFIEDLHPDAFEDTKSYGPGAAAANARKMLPRSSFIDARQGSLLTVFDDRIEITRHDFLSDEPLADDWIVPWSPAEKGKPFMPSRQRAAEKRPMFDATATVEVDRCRRQNRAGESKDAFAVNFPSATAKTASRAMYFEVAAVADGKTFKMKRVSAKGFNRARRRQSLCTECVFALDELPQAVPFRFSVTPVAAFGSRGDPILSEVIKV
ncbi:MAG: metallophosphoesterase [Kiritimatiellae bacterium]|nr:metallophosphoesterase [Kiritimatiellia bacterium]